MSNPEDIECSIDIDIICENRIFDTFWDTSTRCLMTDMCHSFFFNNLIQSLKITDIFFIKSKIWISFVMANILVMASIEIIKTDNTLPIFEKLFNDIASDKARTSCNKYNHKGY